MKHQTINAHINRLNRWKINRAARNLQVKDLEIAIQVATELLTSQGYIQVNRQSRVAEGRIWANGEYHPGALEREEWFRD